MAIEDIATAGFGNSGWYVFSGLAIAGVTTHAVNARLIRQIKGSRSSVDILGLDANLLWVGNDMTANFGTAQIWSGIEVLRTSSQFGNTLPQGINFINPLDYRGVPSSFYPAGIESVWFGYVKSPSITTPTAAANTGYGGAPSTDNTFRFPPGTIRAREDQQLFVVMYGAALLGFGGGVGFPALSGTVNHLRMFSVIGVDYGSMNPDQRASNARSYPRY